MKVDIERVETGEIVEVIEKEMVTIYICGALSFLNLLVGSPHQRLSLELAISY